MSRLEVIVGPMFSGKTEELLRRVRREEIAGKTTAIFRPKLDTRTNTVETHNGTKAKSISVSAAYELYVYDLGFRDVIGIDEGQFFDVEIIEVIDNLLKINKKVIVCGLDKDFATQDFGSIPRLMVLADRLDKLTAVCNKCGSDEGSFTQRLVDGKPARFDGPTILVGGTESYEARCRTCFERG